MCKKFQGRNSYINPDFMLVNVCLPPGCRVLKNLKEGTKEDRDLIVKPVMLVTRLNLLRIRVVLVSTH